MTAMNLQDKSTWTFRAYTGVFPTPPAMPAGAPLPMHALSSMLVAPGSDVVSAADIAAQEQRHWNLITKAVISTQPLNGTPLRSDAMGVPKGLIAPMHLAIAGYLDDAEKAFGGGGAR